MLRQVGSSLPHVYMEKRRSNGRIDNGHYSLAGWFGHRCFLLAFPALFSIVNPVGGAVNFNEVMSGRTRDERHHTAFRITLYALIVLLASLWLGGYILNFFGVSLSALRVAGGLVVAV